jgi:hypothetical protein
MAAKPSTSPPRDHQARVKAAIADQLGKEGKNKWIPTKQILPVLGLGSVLVIPTVIIALLFATWNVMEFKNRVKENRASVGNAGGPPTPPSSQGSNLVPPTPPNNTASSQPCDNHPVTDTETFIKPSSQILGLRGGFVFNTNGHQVLVSVMRGSVKQSPTEVGPGHPKFRFQDSDKMGFYVTLVDETEGTVSFCPKQ